LKVLATSILIDVPIEMLPEKLLNVRVPPLMTLNVENIKPVVLLDVAKIIEPLFIIMGPIGWGVATGIENILVVEIICVHTPPFILIAALPEFP